MKKPVPAVKVNPALYRWCVSISQGELALLGLIVSCQEAGDPLMARQAELAAMRRVSRMTLSRWLRTLRGRGLITVVRVPGKWYNRYYTGPRYEAWKQGGKI